MKVLILGSSGFIGKHLVNAILNETNFTIHGLDFNLQAFDELITDRFKFTSTDVYNDPNMESYILESDVVIQLATICNPIYYMNDPLFTINSNFTNPSKLVDICAKHKKWFINFSSCEVYGKTISSYIGNYDNIDNFKQDEDTTPLILGPVSSQRWSYACAKQLLDRYIYGNAQEFQMPFTIVRPYNFVGRGMDFINGITGAGVPRVLPSFIGSILKKEPIQCVNGGSVYRTFTYIEDAINGILVILNNREASVGQVFNIANPNNEITIYKLAELLKSIIADKTNDNSYLEVPIVNISGDDYYGKGYEDCDRRIPSIEKITKLGWLPKYNLLQTMERTVDGFIEEVNSLNLE